MKLLLVAFSMLLLCTMGSAQDSIPATKAFPVTLPGTQVTLTPGLSFAEVQAAFPTIQLKEPVDFYGFQITMVNLSTELGTYVFAPSFQDSKLALLTFAAADSQPVQTEKNLEDWFHKQVSALPDSAFTHSVEGVDTTDVWQRQGGTWQRKTKIDKKSGKLHIVYLAEFLMNK
jgi:hypothetical protein